MTEEFNAKNLNIIADILLPGDQNGWPSGAITSPYISIYFDNMVDADRKRVSVLEDDLASASPAERIAIMQAFEATDGELFGRIYRWLLDAYYSSPEVILRSNAMANAGPRETSINFDDRMVEKVVETQAGRYRS